MKGKVFTKRVFAAAMTAALTITGIPMANLGVGVETVKAESINQFEATSGTHGATYADGKVTFFIKKTDSFYAQTDTLWYKEYSSYEEAAKNHVASGGNFIEGVGATVLTADSEGIEKSVEISVASDTKAILYYFNAGAGHGRLDYEHIVVLDTNHKTTDDDTEQEEISDCAYIDFEEKAKEPNAFYTWSDNNSASYTYNKTVATITSGWWGQPDWWTVQWAPQNISLGAGEAAVEYDIVSTFDKPVYMKVTQNDSDTPIIEKTFELSANIVTHIAESFEVDSDGLYRVFFNLGGGGATEGTVTISNMKVTGEASNTPVVTVKGKEYDFKATEDNAVNDYADPGKNKEGYELVWADEFDGNYGEASVDEATGLNLDNWAYQLGDGSVDCNNYGWGNNELQSYSDRKDNIAVNEDLTGDGAGDGFLRITAKYEEDGYTRHEAESVKKYSSARIRSTKDDDTLFTTTYGYVEARISLPQTKGAWPAFWMLPESTEIYAGWPVSGEIDIMETVGNRTNEACGTLHWGAPSHVYKGSG